MLQALHFDLVVHSPYRALVGFVKVRVLLLPQGLLSGRSDCAHMCTPRDCALCALGTPRQTYIICRTVHMCNLGQ
eukprot:scaffold151549_cov17-Tisochrysis_lutea.AAC.1